MPKTLLAVLFVSSLVGCKKQGEDPTAKLTELREAMCKCKPGDGACATRVVEDQKKWADAMAKTADAKPDPELAKKLEPIMTEYAKCMTAAMTPVAKPEPVAPAKPALAADPDPAPAAMACTAGERLGADNAWWCWAIPKNATVVGIKSGSEGGTYTWQVGAEILTGGDKKQKPEEAYAEMEQDARADKGEPIAQGQTPGGKGKYLLYKNGSRLYVSARLPVGDYVAWCRIGTEAAKPDKTLLDICRRLTPHVP